MLYNFRNGATSHVVLTTYKTYVLRDTLFRIPQRTKLACSKPSRRDWTHTHSLDGKHVLLSGTRAAFFSSLSQSILSVASCIVLLTFAIPDDTQWNLDGDREDYWRYKIWSQRNCSFVFIPVINKMVQCQKPKFTVRQKFAELFAKLLPGRVFRVKHTLCNVSSTCPYLPHCLGACIYVLSTLQLVSAYLGIINAKHQFKCLHASIFSVDSGHAWNPACPCRRRDKSRRDNKISRINTGSADTNNWSMWLTWKSKGGQAGATHINKDEVGKETQRRVAKLAKWRGGKIRNDANDWSINQRFELYLMRLRGDRQSCSFLKK